MATPNAIINRPHYYATFFGYPACCTALRGINTFVFWLCRTIAAIDRNIQSIFSKLTLSTLNRAFPILRSTNSTCVLLLSNANGITVVPFSNSAK